MASLPRAARGRVGWALLAVAAAWMARSALVLVPSDGAALLWRGDGGRRVVGAGWHLRLPLLEQVHVLAAAPLPLLRLAPNLSLAEAGLALVPDALPAAVTTAQAPPADDVATFWCGDMVPLRVTIAVQAAVVPGPAAAAAGATAMAALRAHTEAALQAVLASAPAAAWLQRGSAGLAAALRPALAAALAADGGALTVQWLEVEDVAAAAGMETWARWPAAAAAAVARERAAAALADQADAQALASELEAVALAAAASASAVEAAIPARQQAFEELSALARRDPAAARLLAWQRALAGAQP